MTATVQNCRCVTIDPCYDSSEGYRTKASVVVSIDGVVSTVDCCLSTAKTREKKQTIMNVLINKTAKAKHSFFALPNPLSCNCHE